MNMGISKTSDHIQIKLKISNPSHESPASSKIPNEDSKDMMLFAPSKSRWRANIQNMGVPKTSDHIYIKI